MLRRTAAATATTATRSRAASNRVLSQFYNRTRSFIGQSNVCN